MLKMFAGKAGAPCLVKDAKTTSGERCVPGFRLRSNREGRAGKELPPGLGGCDQCCFQHSDL